VNKHPRGPFQPIADKSSKQAGAYSIETLEREAEELRRTTPASAGWSRAGTLELHAWSKVYFAEIAPGLRTNHRRCHRRKHKDECGPLCEAHDEFAVVWLTCPADKLATTLPLLSIVIPRITELCGCKVHDAASFARGVRRDVDGLAKALAINARKRDKTARALIRRYPNACALLQHAAACLSGPALKPA
jgi:hypothetical protein